MGVEKGDSVALHLRGPFTKQPGPCTPSSLCPLQGLGHNWEVGVTPLLVIKTQPSRVGPRTPRRHATGGGPQFTECQGPQPRREGHVQSVTETMILRISSASWGSGFSRSSMMWVVRILPVLLLMW